MRYSLKGVLIVAAAGVVAFFVAELVIPEKSAVTAKNGAVQEQRQAQAVNAPAQDGDIPVVMVDKPSEPPVEVAKAAPVDTKADKAADVKTVKPEPVNTKTVAAIDTKTVKAEPVDTQTVKTVDANAFRREPVDGKILRSLPFDTKVVRMTYAKAAAPEPVDTKAAKAADTKVATAADTKAVKPEPVDTKLAKAPDTKAVKPEPVDTKVTKVADAKIAKTEPVDAKLAKAPDTKTAAPPQSAPAELTPAQKKAAASGAPYKIEKTAICSAIKDREPSGITNKFSKDAPYVYYYTHVTGARDTTAVIHRWYQNGKLIQTSILPVKSSYWRTHSRRNLLTHVGDVTGQWRVDVVASGSNTVIESASFTIE